MVSGRSRSGSIPAGPKPIPGTTLTLPPHPTAPGHPARSRSLSGPSYPPLPQAGEATVDHGSEPAAHDAAAEDKDRAAKAKFFLEDASSAGSRTSSESGYSEHRATNSSNAGSYAEACKKAAAVAVPAAAAAGGTGAGDTGLGSRGGGSQAQSGGKYAQLGGARIGGRGEEKWSGGRDREFARREQARPDGRYGRGGRGHYHPRGRGGDFDNNRGGNYDGRGGNYGRSRGRYYQHADQQYSRQGSRQSRSEPQFSGQETNDNRNLRRTVSDRPPDTGDR